MLRDCQGRLPGQASRAQMEFLPPCLAEPEIRLICPACHGGNRAQRAWKRGSRCRELL